jgi:DNA-binding CsgD family transcriptional regulator
MDRAIAWCAAALGLANFGLVLSVVVPLCKSRAAARREQSAVGSRLGLLIELGLLLFGAAALTLSALALTAALGSDVVEHFLHRWGILGLAAVFLVVFLLMRRDFVPVLDGVRRSERALKVLLGAFQPASLDPRSLGLSYREEEVLAVIAAGKATDQQIAETLFISPATAATHVRNILRKADLHDRRQLVLIGLERSGPPDPAGSGR